MSNVKDASRKTGIWLISDSIWFFFQLVFWLGFSMREDKITAKLQSYTGMATKLCARYGWLWQVKTCTCGIAFYESNYCLTRIRRKKTYQKQAQNFFSVFVIKDKQTYKNNNNKNMCYSHIKLRLTEWFSKLFFTLWKVSG